VGTRNALSNRKRQTGLNRAATLLRSTEKGGSNVQYFETTQATGKRQAEGAPRENTRKPRGRLRQTLAIATKRLLRPWSWLSADRHTAKHDIIAIQEPARNRMHQSTYYDSNFVFRPLYIYPTNRHNSGFHRPLYNRYSSKGQSPWHGVSNITKHL
jgi:hypothetical protein